ncbi:MAG: class I SAM-dependent methyltransferase [Burkholderiales bacterium]
MTSQPSPERMRAPLQAGLTQVGAAACALLPLVAGLDMTLAQWAVVQGAIAMRIAFFAGAASWWVGLHVAFAPAAVWANTLALSPAWWAGAFVLLLAAFGATFRTQVPLFLTARKVRSALCELLDPARSLEIVDLGCGLGSVITTLKRLRPECDCHGVELALLPYLVSRLRGARSGCRVERRDLMTVDLSRYDVVYAFLSPAPMPQLWAKARREMRPGSRFVSLAFAVPGVPADQVIAVGSKPRHTLYVWTM